MLRSSINEHDAHVKWVFVVCLLLCDRDGNFRCTPESMARTAVIPLDQAVDALEKLSSPDGDSTSQEEEGRRIVSRGPNQWHVVNYVQYRRRMLEEKARIKDRQRKRDERGQVRTGSDTSGQDGTDLDPVGVGVGVDVCDVSPKERKKKKRSVFKPPSFEDVMFYIEEKGLEVIPHIFIDFYESKGWMVGKSRMKDWKAACRRSQDWDQMQAAWAKKGKAGSQHVGAAAPTNGEWVVETYRRSDMENHGNHSMWEQYTSEAADLPPKTAPPFDEWLLENMTPEG
jgi:hypothetical protein